MVTQTAIVTGANCGIGLAVATRLCKEGFDVILACRNKERGQSAVEGILKQKADAQATFMQLDLADMSSVRTFAKEFQATGKQLNLLINNAGVYLSGDIRQVTKDNFELTMGTNHLGHFLLTVLLIGEMKKTAIKCGEARIVVVASSLHDSTVRAKLATQPLNVDDFFLTKPKTYSSHQAYKNSKLANVLFTYVLAEQLHGTGVTVNCLCPGFIPATELTRHASRFQKLMLQHVLFWVLRFSNITKTLDEGADSVMDLATGSKMKGVSGKFFKDREEAKSSEESYSKDLQRQVWDLSAYYCHLKMSLDMSCTTDILSR